MRDGDVLVVEDERIVALNLRQQLTKLGYRVAGVVSSGVEALRLIEELRPAVVLMDIHIEGELDGIETASRLPSDSESLVIYLSAYAEDTTLERASSTGPYGYIVKPYSERELHATIQMALERRELDGQLRATQKLLRQQRDAAQRYLDIAGVVLLERDLAGNITLINRQGLRLLGYDDPEELIGRPWEDHLVQGDDRTGEDEVCRKLLSEEGDRIQKHMSHILAKTGEQRCISWHSSALRCDDGRLIGFLSSGEDITEKLETEAHLRQSQKMEAIGTLTGGIAHDFNNLLGIVIGNLRLAVNRPGKDDEMEELIGEALNAAWHGAELTRGLLAFARRQPLRPAQIDVNGLITDTMRLLRRMIGDHIEVSLYLAEDLWRVTADPAQLQSSLANLATNARDAMPKGGRLIISTGNRHLDADYAASHVDTTAGNYVVIEVSDTGTGMSAELKRKIFEPFYTTKKEGKGTGLGLSMVFGFLKQSSGHVNVYSEQGLGTTFRLYLPRADASSHPSELAAPYEINHAGGRTVLVVEDNPNVRRVVVKQLLELGYRVLECDAAVRALDILEAEPVNLLFTDIVMPGGLDGIELARLVGERWPTLKVVLTSGFPEDRIDDLGEINGPIPLLSKPYSKVQLATVLSNVLAEGNADTLN
jgi:PAS domain S-box-containing protein